MHRVDNGNKQTKQQQIMKSLGRQLKLGQFYG